MPIDWLNFQIQTTPEQLMQVHSTVKMYDTIPIILANINLKLQKCNLLPILCSEATTGFVDNTSEGNAPPLDSGVRVESLR